eukprot:gene23800-9362_t
MCLLLRSCAYSQECVGSIPASTSHSPDCTSDSPDCTSHSPDSTSHSEAHVGAPLGSQVVEEHGDNHLLVRVAYSQECVRSRSASTSHSPASASHSEAHVGGQLVEDHRDDHLLARAAYSHKSVESIRPSTSHSEAHVGGPLVEEHRDDHLLARAAYSQAYVERIGPSTSHSKAHVGGPLVEEHGDDHLLARAAYSHKYVESIRPSTSHSEAHVGGQLVEEHGDDHLLARAAYSQAYVESIRPSTKPATLTHQRVAFYLAYTIRKIFDFVTGYGPGRMSEAKWLRRIIYLESIAGVPGIVAGLLRHMRALRTMQKDGGWIHTLIAESENERMHLLTFLQLRPPSVLLRSMVACTQCVFFTLFFLAYLVSPKACHALVGYLEEEAVKTYTLLLAEIDAGLVWQEKRAPAMAVAYWKLPQDATMRDVVLCVRADEAGHAHVNHTFSDMDQSEKNPFINGRVGMDQNEQNAIIPGRLDLNQNEKKAIIPGCVDMEQNEGKAIIPGRLDTLTGSSHRLPR